MFKNHKWKLLASSLVILLPMLFGLAVWDSLPRQMINHWGVDGTADSVGSRATVVFVLPLVLLAVHWLGIFITAKDRGNANQSRRVVGMVLWIIPLLSVFVNGLVYAVALGMEFSPMVVLFLSMGVLFLVMGNYMPKCRQNSTIGIKIKWTLENEENWNATHRLAGKLWAAGGVLMLGGIFLPIEAGVGVMLGVILVMVAIPVGYSCWYYRKQLRDGAAENAPCPGSKPSKRVTAGSLIVGIAILAAVFLFVSAGKIRVDYQADRFTIDADFWEDITVRYDAVTAMEYRENVAVGSRTIGFGGTRIQAGSFRNGEFGNYTRYSYAGNKGCVVLYLDEHVLVLNGPDEAATKAIYEQLKANIQ